MTDLIKNELLKLKRSRSVKILFWYLVLYSGFSALVYGGTDEGSVMAYGFSAPFMAFGLSGVAGFFFYSAIAAGLVADEFRRGTVRNALSCGVARRSYFAAKTACLLGITLLLYLSGVLAHSLCKNALFAFDPCGLLYSRYWLKVLVFNLAAALLTMCYMSVYIFIGFLCRRGVLTFVVSTLATTLEFLWYAKSGPEKAAGPTAAMWEMLDMIRTDSSSDRLLQPDFLLLLLPSLCLGAVCLAAAYLLFKRADIK